MFLRNLYPTKHRAILSLTNLYTTQEYPRNVLEEPVPDRVSRDIIIDKPVHDIRLPKKCSRCTLYVVYRMIISRDIIIDKPVGYRFLKNISWVILCRIAGLSSMIISRDTLSGTGSSRTFLGYPYVVYRFVNDNIARYSVGYRFLKNISWVLLCRVQVCQ